MKKSDTISELAKALTKAQTSYNSLIKDSNNPFFKSKYADLAACIECVREPLASNGLAIIQSTDYENGVTFVETTLIHTSGEWISGKYPLTPTKQDCQGLGAALTYARRYSLTSLLGIAAEDDDGNSASGKIAEPKTHYIVSPWSKEVTDKAAKIEKDGLVGSAALSLYIPRYNEKMKTSYKNIQDFNSDKLLNGLIKFVEDIPPANLTSK